MITYIKTKIKEHRIKLALYSTIEDVMNEKEDILNTVKNLYLVLKDAPVNELRDQFIEKLAEIIYDNIHTESDDEEVK